MNGRELLRVKQLFLQASDLPPDERGAFLDAQDGLTPEVRARVEAQLARFERDDRATLQSPAAQQFDEADPAAIGPYRVRRRIGEGGMGVVYLADQTEPVQRQVAVKRIKAGMDSKALLRRFEAERHALELMDHPAIARILDTGVDEHGRPYFALEYVDGVSLIEYCDREQLGVDARLRLFLDVLKGVQHAHQKGVLHRDLKPGNVLVVTIDDQPVPKIIDFGVAKALDQRLTEQTVHTQLGVMIGTPEYMSPEQSEPGASDVDTRTDIYSLGVLLYELLSGQLPFAPDYLRRQGVAGLQRTLQTEDPPRPSTRVDTFSEQTTDRADTRQLKPRALAQRLRGDLDWITMRALHKRPDDRYASCSEFAADIDRHLRDEPVLAGPPTIGYRLAKLARRYRTQAVTGLLAASVLLLGTGVSLWFAFRTQALAEQLDEARLDVVKENRMVERALDRAAERLEQRSEQPSDQESQTGALAQLHATLGEAYTAIGRPLDSAKHLRQAFALLDRTEASPQVVYACLRPYLLVDLVEGGFTASTRFDERHLQAARDILYPGEVELQRAIVAVAERNYDDPGQEEFAHVLRVARRRFQPGDPRWVTLADVLVRQLFYTADSIEPGERVLAIYAEQDISSTDPGWLYARMRMMTLCNRPRIARYDLACTIAEDTLSVIEQALPRRHWFEGLVRLERGRALTQLARLEEAETELRAATELLADTLGGDHLQTGWGLQSLVACLDEMGRQREAEGLRLELADFVRRGPFWATYECAEIVLRPDLGALAQSLRELNQLRGSPARALPRLNAILSQCRQHFPEPDARAATVAKLLISVGSDLSNSGAHSAPMRRLFAYADEVLSATSAGRTHDQWWLARHCYLLGDFEAGARAASLGLTGPQAVTDPTEAANLRSKLGLCRFELAGDEASLELAISGYRELVARVGPNNGNTNGSFQHLLGAMRRAGAQERARELAAERLQLLAADGDARSLWSLVSDVTWLLGDDDLAAKVVVAMDAKNAGDFRSLCAHAQLAALRYDRKAASAYAKQALTAGPDSWVCQNAIARVYSRLGRQDEADACAARAIELRNTASMRNNRAVWLFRLGQRDPAHDLFEDNLDAYPDYALAHANVARSLLACSQLDEARTSAQRAFEREPQVGRGILAQVRLARGEDCADLFAAQAAWAGRPDGSGFWPDYFEALTRAGRGNEARERLVRLTTEWPSEPFAWSARAWALCRIAAASDADLRTARECAERAVERSGDQGPVMWAALAEAQFRLGDAKAAVASIDACRRAMAGQDTEWLTLAQVARRRSTYLGR